MFTEAKEIKWFDYRDFRVNIFSHKNDGKDGNNDTYCFSIVTYDENNIPDEVIFNSEDNHIFADTVEDAIDNAYEYIDRHF